MAYEDLKPFNKMSQWASKNGGPDKAIKLLEETNRLLGEKIGFRKGIEKGRIQGAGISIVVIGGVTIAKKMWDNHREKTEEKRHLEEKAEIARKMIIKEITKENSESSEVKEQGESDTP